MFSHLIAIQPLGLLYGSAGAFLSPENLVGRSGTHFPPSAATLSGIFAFTHRNDSKIKDLHLAGPFWGKSDEVLNQKNQDFYVPTPLNYLVKPDPECGFDDRMEIKTGTIEAKLSCEKSCELSSDAESELYVWSDKNSSGAGGKPVTDTWLALSQWDNPKTVKFAPWQFLPHLHPKLREDERHVVSRDESPDDPGSLFLENAVQMHPDTCLVYLTNMEIPSGWYRFGGEGHLVEVSCLGLAEKHRKRLAQQLDRTFALIVPAVWGSNRLSHRYPEAWKDKLQTVLTQRPTPFRYRLGNRENHKPHHPKLLSRGRYAVPAGTVYILKESLPPWQDWPVEPPEEKSPKLFPREGPSLKRWGCGLALSLPKTLQGSG